MKRIYKVYKITNLINQKIYIGQTVKLVEQRFKQHIKIGNSYISKSIKKYGTDNFKIEWIATALSKDHINDLEEYFILELNSLSPNGYNLRTEGTMCLTSEKFSELLKIDTDARWKDILLNNKHFGFECRPIIGINESLEIIKFNSISEAYRSKIYPDLSLKYQTYRANGYFFFYQDEVSEANLINTMTEIIKIKDERFKQSCENRRLGMLKSNEERTDNKITAVNPLTKDIIHYRNIRHAVNLGVSTSALMNSLKPTEEKINRYKGYHFFYTSKHTIDEMFKLAEERNEIIHQRFLAGRKKARANNQKSVDSQKKSLIGINPDTLEYKIFESGSEAMKQGYSRGGINPGLKGLKRTSKGLHFQYYTKSIEEHIEIVKSLYS